MLPQEARKRIARLRARCNAAIFARLLLAATAVYLVAAGTVTLATRLFLPGLRGYLYVLLPGFALALGAAVYFFRRQRYRDSDVEAIADRMEGAGGLLLTLSSWNDPLWEQELRRVMLSRRQKLPRLRYSMFLRVVPYAAFLVLALVIPQRMFPGRRVVASPLEYEELKKIESQLELISEENLLPPQELESLQEEIDEMLESAKESHEARWEGIDALQEKLGTEMESALQTLTGADQAATWGGKEQLEKALYDLAKKGLLDNLPPELARHLGKKGEKLLEGGGLPQDAEAIRAARRCLKRLAKSKCSKLLESGLCKGKAGSGAPTAGLDDFEMVEAEEPSYELVEKPGGKGTKGLPGGGKRQGGAGDKTGQSLTDGFDKKGGDRKGEGQPGRGGIDRGRGDAPMVWGDESDEQKVKFAPKELPPVTLSPGEEMPVVGISIVEPEQMRARGGASKSRVIDFGRTGGSGAWRRKVSPRHRGPVRRYFSQKKPGKP